MKKITKLTLCGLAVLMLAAGCSKKDENKEVPTTEEQVTTEAIVAEATEDATSPGKLTTLGAYKGVEVTKQSTAVTDEEVETQIESLLQASPEYIDITDRPAQNGDIVNIDFVGMKDGVAFEGGTASGFDLTLGSHSFIDGFEDGIIGARAGAELSLNLTFPDPYSNNPDLAGQPVVFDVTVNSIQEKRDAVLDNSFVQRVSEFNTVDEFKADILADLEATKEETADQQLSNDALQAAVDNCEFEINPTYVEEQYNSQLEYVTSMVQMYGQTLADYAAMFGQTEEQVKQNIREDCELIAKQEILMKAIAEKEGFQLEEADYQQLIDTYGMSVKELKSNYGEEAVDETAMMFKTAQFIKDNAVIK